mmetsp:Transcript_5176/g.13952  ORF Transcript_5176/g.13952 Transcript_5176/m.13952 type:complete len:314 (-) Transcript_5176:158-1099(-)|eukprot:CAMPEP_0198111930 /NCGR_PEP_ID=MMETSP1442-20131203/3847_1 /TAXON_ID= /ORGANISM="Craspedostauros australis, Strain CCMP3328" /LENGTH=313 /DNA_ID=CAMNT_0043768539 /DNA_START=113 /DNA_END=1054 /DNA_ORIENTATION=-
MTSDGDNKDLKPTYTSHDGLLMPKGFPVDGFISGLTYEAQPEDLFIATYAKSGTTLTQHIVYVMLNEGVPIQPDERLDHIFPHLEEVGADFVTNLPCIQNPASNGKAPAPFRLIKTHLPRSMTPLSAKAKYVIVTRNPKDVVVSFFHHTRGFEKHYNFADGSFDVFFDLFLKGEVDFGSYFDFLKAWMAHRDDDNVLVVKYEDLRRDQEAVVRDIAKFLDSATLPAMLDVDDGKLMTDILEHTSLSSMKKDPLRWSSERKVGHAPFIRKGSIGGWKELMSDDQAEALVRKMKETFTQEELEWLGDDYHTISAD